METQGMEERGDRDIPHIVHCVILLRGIRRVTDDEADVIPVSVLETRELEAPKHLTNIAWIGVGY
jgi:hypothetical protein